METHLLETKFRPCHPHSRLHLTCNEPLWYDLADCRNTFVIMPAFFSPTHPYPVSVYYISFLLVTILGNSAALYRYYIVGISRFRSTAFFLSSFVLMLLRLRSRARSGFIMEFRLPQTPYTQYTLRCGITLHDTTTFPPFLAFTPLIPSQA